MNIKKIIFAATLACVFSLTADAARWSAKSNADLRAAMLARAELFRQAVVGQEISNDLTAFICEVNALAASQPYAWLIQTHKFVNEQLRRYPLGMNLPYGDKETNFIIRKNLLYLRDFPMHEANMATETPAPEAGQAAAFEDACEYYLGAARRDFLNWLDSPAPTAPGELQLFKEYNMGFAFRTSERLVLIDIKWDGTDEEAAYIASKADIIFLTHNHSDHYSQVLLNEMAKAGKYLVMPLDKVPTYTDTEKKIVRTDDFEPVNLDGVEVQGFMGVQNGTPCFVYAIEFDGWRIAHAGDNQSGEAESNLQNLEGFDVATIACFSTPSRILEYILKSVGQDKRDLVFLSGHENERTHNVYGRIGYNEDYEESAKFGSATFDYPSIFIMDNGEYATLKK